MKQGKILAADYHRNGVDGAPFYVALVDDPDTGRKLLVITFDGDEPGDDAYTAVIDPAAAAAGNVYMNPVEEKPPYRTGGNAWRGDRFAETYRQAIIAHVTREQDERFEAYRQALQAKCGCMTEDPGDGYGERVVEHSAECPLHPLYDEA